MKYHDAWSMNRTDERMYSLTFKGSNEHMTLSGRHTLEVMTLSLDYSVACNSGKPERCPCAFWTQPVWPPSRLIRDETAMQAMKRGKNITVADERASYVIVKYTHLFVKYLRSWFCQQLRKLGLLECVNRKRLCWHSCCIYRSTNAQPATLGSVSAI